MGTPIDSTVYRHVYRSLLGRADTDAGHLPHPMRAEPQGSASALQVVGAFLEECMAPAGGLCDRNGGLLARLCASPPLHCLAAGSIAFFRSTLSQEGDSSSRDHNRGYAAALYRLVLECTAPNGSPALGEMDARDHALIVVLLEAGMHAALAPNASEGEGKRGAHLHFALMRKKMHALDPRQRGTLAGLLWASAVCSCTTEGIRECPLPAEKRTITSRITFPFEGAPYSLAVLQTLRPAQTVVIHEPATSPPLPGNRLCEGSTLRLWTAQGEVHWARQQPPAPILRKHVRGWRYDCHGSTATRHNVCTLRVVVLVLESTLYRIDILNPGTDGPVSIAAVRLSVPVPFPLAQHGPDRYCGGDVTRMILEVCENPLGLHPSPDGSGNKHELCTPHPFELVAPVQTVTAWCSGNGVTDINRTTLLGIHDQ